MRIEELTSAEQVEALVPEWEQLWRDDPAATPFQSPQWLLSCWRSLGAGDLHILALRDGGTLEALAPLVILRDEDDSLGLLLGTGVSDYLDILARPRADLAPLAASLCDVDCLAFDFQQLRASSPLLLLRASDAWTDRVEDHDPCPAVTLDPAFPEGLPLSSGFRKRLRYYRRALEREGPLSFETPEPETLDSFLDALFRLHEARWRRRNLPGVLGDPAVQQFHRAAARGLLEAGALRMYAMRVGTEVVAVFYGFAHHETVYYYLGGFDPALEKMSPGTVIVAHAIAEAAASGAMTFDFLRGAEDYKYGWGATDRLNRRRQWIRG